MKKILTIVAAATVSAFMIAPALADRHPNVAERKKIERALTAAGYTSWGEIDLDHEHRREIWEVEDARHRNGHKFDLELDARTLKIINRDRD